MSWQHLQSGLPRSGFRVLDQDLSDHAGRLDAAEPLVETVVVENQAAMVQGNAVEQRGGDIAVS